MYGRKQVTQYLIECDGDTTAVEEVLSCYALYKYAKGASSGRVLFKIKALCEYMRSSGHGEVLQRSRTGFRVTALEVSVGGDRIGISPALTPTGKKAANDLRRLIGQSTVHSTDMGMTDTRLGGPLPIGYVATEAKRLSMARVGMDRGLFPETPEERIAMDWTIGTRPAWAEEYFIARARVGEDTIQPMGFAAEDLPAYLERLTRLESRVSEGGRERMSEGVRMVGMTSSIWSESPEYASRAEGEGGGGEDAAYIR